MAGSAAEFGRLKLLQLAGSDHHEAKKAVARMVLRSYLEKYETLNNELAHHQSETWDVEELREWALDPETEVDQETFTGAWTELFNQILQITAATAPLLAGDQGESEVFEARLRQSFLDLFFHLNNPVIRYAIIAGFEPRFRDEVDQMLTRIGREVWGTAGALVRDEIQVENFPPGTAELLLSIAARIEDGGETAEVDE